MGISIGIIIGAGVMVMSIAALKMTGRSVNIAFMIAALFTVIAAIPFIFYSSCICVRCGFYTQAAVFLGPQFAGFYIITFLFSNLSIAMYAIGMTSYLFYIFPSIKQFSNIATALIMSLFFILNFFGTEWMAKAQNFMFYLLLAAIALFCLFGLPKVQWGGYFGNSLFGRPLIENGFNGLMMASSFLTFATGGATTIVNMSAEATNPKKDMPFVIITSALIVAVLYALMATVIGGVLPPR